MKKLNKVFRAKDIKEIDKCTIEREPISSLELMERAAGVWVVHFLQLPIKYTGVAVVAGNGNNGGDGYAIARLLKERGIRVRVFCLGKEEEMSPDCKENYKRWRGMGGEIVTTILPEDFRIGKDEVVIDAIFSVGLNRPVTGLVREVIHKLNASENKVVAVDMPSGLMGEDNSENDREAIVCADYTLTFQFPKLAFMLPENACYVGVWEVLDIGLDRGAIAELETLWYYTTAEEVHDKLPKPEKYAHKGMNGRGLLIAGRDGMMGAAVLAAKAALHSGVGLLYCHVPKRGGDILQTAVPESLLERDVCETHFSGVADAGKYDAIAVGPALGQGPETVKGVSQLLSDWRGITIIDADALNIMAEHRELLELLHERCILTPHMKEFERLAGKSKNDFDRLNKLSIFAGRFHTYVVLKGAHSVVATPDGKLYFNMSGNPGMAKGGAGDVLTGVLLGLAANGLEALDIARIGVYAHGLSGDLLASEYGYRGISAGMIAVGMGKAWKKLETEK